MQTTGASGRLQYKDKKKVDRRNLTGGRKKYTQAYLCTWYTGNESTVEEPCWVLKNWCLLTAVLEKTLESPLDYREIQSILKEINPENSLKGLMLKLNLQCFGQHHDVKSWLIGKDPDAGKDWRQKEKRAAQDKMIGWHHWLNGHEFEQTPEDSEGQGSLVCYSPWGCRVWHDFETEQQ